MEVDDRFNVMLEFLEYFEYHRLNNNEQKTFLSIDESVLLAGLDLSFLSFKHNNNNQF